MFLIPCLIDSIALCKREERARSESNAGGRLRAGSGGHPLGRFKVDRPSSSHCWWSLADDREGLTRAEKARQVEGSYGAQGGLMQRTSVRCLRLIECLPCHNGHGCLGFNFWSDWCARIFVSV